MSLKSLIKFQEGRLTLFDTLSSVPNNWQENPTPLSIVRKMVDKTDLDQKNILVLFNIEFLEVLVFERHMSPDRIYYIADNAVEKKVAETVYKVNAYITDKDAGVAGLKKLIESI
jgi:hypothetical protein